MHKTAALALFAVMACSAGGVQPAPASQTNPPASAAPPPQAAPAPAGEQTFAEVSAERAFEDLRQLVAIGPRPAGSPGIRQTRAFITKQMQAIGLTVREQAFMASTPVGQVPMANLIVTLPGKRPDRILIASHYDTKPEKDFVFVGANDGGSSTALLMELARVLKDKPREFTWELVFFDGEEAWGDWATGNTFGSRHYVDAGRRDGTLKGVKALVLLDMIGERGLEIRQDLNSTRWLNELVWRVAGRLGHQRTFVPDITSVEDDHFPFLKAGIPAIDLIDLDYPAWHTAQDTLDKIDPRSMKIVGDVVVAALPEIEQRLKTQD
ncbi:MAG TPA: M28 family peptidase [Vicinamibacterales bacterium]